MGMMVSSPNLNIFTVDSPSFSLLLTRTVSPFSQRTTCSKVASLTEVGSVPPERDDTSALVLLTAAATMSEAVATVMTGGLVSVDMVVVLLL